jgi:hypothetical protein
MRSTRLCVFAGFAQLLLVTTGCDRDAIVCDADMFGEEGRLVRMPAGECRARLAIPSGVVETQRRLDEDPDLTLVSLSDVVDALPNIGYDAQPIDPSDPAIPAYNFPDYLEGFRWNEQDFDGTEWFNQGITGSSDALEEGALNGRRILLSTWYSKSHDPERGARATVSDITDLGHVLYAHLLLAEPIESSAKFRAIPTHAGGAVWYGDLLYVAETERGFRVFDLQRIVPADPSETDRIGAIGSDVMAAFGCDYLLPQIAVYKITSKSDPIRFSFVGMDRSVYPNELVSGQYQQRHWSGLIVHWAIGNDGWLVPDGDRVVAEQILISGERRMQGVVSFNGEYLLSTTSQFDGFDDEKIEGFDNHTDGKLYIAEPGAWSREHPAGWAEGGEDLYFERDRNLVWTTTEYPQRRYVFGVEWNPPQ